MSVLAKEIATVIEKFLFDGGAEISKLQHQNFEALIDQKLSGVREAVDKVYDSECQCVYCKILAPINETLKTDNVPETLSGGSTRRRGENDK